jgi:hypothetical protein
LAKERAYRSTLADQRSSFDLYFTYEVIVALDSAWMAACPKNAG